MENIKCNECNRTFASEDALKMHNSAKHYKSSKEKKLLSKKYIWIIAIIGIILISGLLIYYNSNTKNYQSNLDSKNINQDNKDSLNPTTDNNNNNNNNNDIQKITLSFKDYTYFPNTIRVKQGVPVEITLDNSISGCFRTLNIQALGVSGTSSNPSQTIKFTPTSKGSFVYACGMHMATGTIIVE